MKVVGEDITEGKVTAPIAKAMSLLKTQAERQEIWDIVKSRPSTIRAPPFASSLRPSFLIGNLDW